MDSHSVLFCVECAVEMWRININGVQLVSDCLFCVAVSDFGQSCSVITRHSR